MLSVDYGTLRGATGIVNRPKGRYRTNKLSANKWGVQWQLKPRKRWYQCADEDGKHYEFPSEEDAEAYTILRSAPYGVRNALEQLTTLPRLRELNNERAVEWNGKDMNRFEKLSDSLFRSNELGGKAGEAIEVIADVCHISILGLRLADKVGQTLNTVKKFHRGHEQEMPGAMTHADAYAKLFEELADVVICVDRLADSFNIDLRWAIKKKFNDTSDKHGFKTKFNSGPFG